MSRVTPPDKIAWILIRERKLLVGRNERATRFYLPGGGREDGETDLQVLEREIAEELSVRIDNSTALHVATVVARRDNSEDDLVYIAYSAEHHEEPRPSMEVVELAWVTTADGDRVTDAERQIMAILHGRGLVD
jgi:8-oxo-dGTP pyrophosphatase MutT (NUDIX family)